MRDLLKLAALATIIVVPAMLLAGCKGSYGGRAGGSAYYGNIHGLHGYHFSAPPDGGRITTHATPQGTGWEWSY